jgi:hypothetical protein
VFSDWDVPGYGYLIIVISSLSGNGFHLFPVNHVAQSEEYEDVKEDSYEGIKLIFVEGKYRR